MAPRQWLFSEEPIRQRMRRNRGRRASDRAPSLEALLVAGVIIAWGWGAYQLAALFVP